MKQKKVMEFSMQTQIFDKRWFGIEERDKKYRFLLFAPNNKKQLMGHSEWVCSEESCKKIMFNFISAVCDHTYKIEIRSSTSKPKAYYCTFIDDSDACLLMARGYPSAKKAREREIKICEAVEKSIDFQKEKRLRK